ncbi:MAG: chromosome segregation protein SMC [candidate division Zixibacteria bacterium]|nr:chromosome segregation protein SMC [candidate division Zixibacteria bacterium]
MFLSRLEIVGFKSFPERTEVRFGTGITGIVGPNGCGKTNLLDAIRWVMGEQRPTLLRGGRMEEVIFNGAPGVGPVGMAEVSLTVENNRGILPVEYSEVVITRRLFRSGESEYLLNRVPCRLKDIVELFLDTGMGSHAYAVFQQTMIDALLSEKPEDRLGLFEEAAGVAKYKLRRRAAERKLEATEVDLVRLNDLFSEIERQYNSLKRQVKKAERFKNLEEEKQGIKVKLAALEYRELKAGEEKALSAVKALEIEEAELSAQRRKLELEKEKFSLVRLEKEGEKRKLEEGLSLLDRQQVELEGRRALLLKENESFAERKAELESESKRLSERGEAIAEAAFNLSEEKKRLVSSKSGLEKQVAAAEQELTGFTFRAAELAKKKQTLLAGQGSLRAARAEREAEKKVWESKAAEADVSLKSLGEEKEKLAAELAAQSREKLKFEKELEGLSEGRAGLNEKIEALEKSLSELTARKESLGFKKQNLENQLSELGGRLAVLEDLEKGYGGYEPAVREILSRRKAFPGLVDSLANLISSDEQYFGSIEAALGERAQAVVATSWQEAVRAVEFLKEKKLGRARFLVLPEEELVQPEAEGWPGAVGWASDLVWGEEPKLAFVRRALAKILVVENREAAFRLAGRAGEGITLVTLAAEVLGPGGYFAGGESKGAILVGRKAELARLKEKVADLEKRKTEIATILDEVFSRQESGKKELDDLVAGRNRLSEEETGLRLELEMLTFEEAALAEKIGALDKSGSEFFSRRKEAGETLARLGAELEQLEIKETEQAGILALLEQETGQLGKLEREKQEDLTKTRMELISALAHLESAEKDLLRLADEKSQLAGQAAEKRKKLLELLDIHENFDVRVVELGSEGEEINARRTAVTTAQERLAKETAELSSHLAAVERGLKETVAKLEQSFEQKHQKQLIETDWRARKESLSTRFEEEFRRPLETLTERPVSPEETVESLKKRLEEIDRSLGNIGAVNLEALTEYPQTAERYEFMKKQILDLTRAKLELEGTISQINKSARELFMKTFEQARENFQNLFAELFEGGQADLILEGGGDPIEPDLKIVARPKGKKLVTIQQLSGGEKALTAIALLFALYMVKPSPFCILDEIDAPLDDANIDRFLAIIRKFSTGDTQFIIITHNKRTMEAADVLYGVTMEKTGISKIVSVRLEGQPVGVLSEREVSEITR